MSQDILQKIQSILPKQPGILGREQYRNAAILISLLFAGDEPYFLFEKRGANIRQGGEISFPGGMVDVDDENTKATAIRETIEELGIEKGSVEVLGQMDTLVSPQGTVVDGYIGLLHIGMDEFRINKDEVEYVFTVPITYFMNHEPQEYSIRIVMEPSYIDENGEKVVLLPGKELNLPIRYHESWGFTTQTKLVYVLEQGTLWGMTAEFVYDLVKRLK